MANQIEDRYHLKVFSFRYPKGRTTDVHDPDPTMARRKAHQAGDRIAASPKVTAVTVRRCTTRTDCPGCP